jgi:hypothetical protein
VAVAIRDSTLASYGAAGVTPTVVTGDVLVAFVNFFYSDTLTISPPSGDGWTLFATANSGTGAFTFACFWKHVTNAGTESSTKTFTASGGGDNKTIIVSLSGADTTAPIQATYQTDNQAPGDASISFGTLAIARADSVELATGVDYGWFNSLAAIGSLTTLEDNGEQMAWALTPATGATASATKSDTGAPSTVMRIAVQPPAGGGSTSDPGESAGMRQLRMNPVYRMSPRSEREAQTFLRAQKRAYGFASAQV